MSTRESRVALENIELYPDSTDEVMIEETLRALMLPPRVKRVRTMRSVGALYRRVSSMTSVDIISSLLLYYSDVDDLVRYYLGTISSGERKLIVSIVMLDAGRRDLAEEYLEESGVDYLTMLHETTAAQFFVWIRSELSISYLIEKGWNPSKTDLRLVRSMLS